MMKIYLIRHGYTHANEKKLYAGATDLPLSQAGVRALKELRAQGIYPGEADLYFTSGLLRTEQTLELICGPVQATALPSLAEYNFGQFEMHSYERLKEREDYTAWVADQTDLLSCPGGENRQQFYTRVQKGLAQLFENSRGKHSVLAVLHGGVIARIMQILLPGVREFYMWQPMPGRGFVLEYKNGEVADFEEA